MKPKRVFQVFQQEQAHHKDAPVGIVHAVTTPPGCWRFRILAPRAPVAHRIVGGSGEAFDSKSNAMRAARREASLYPPGIAAVEVVA